MRRLLKWLGQLALVLAIYAVQIAVSSLLPFPASRFNLIIAFLLWLLFFDERRLMLWSLPLLGFLTELFVSTPFGASLIALFFGLLAADWLWSNLLTNRSLSSVFFLSLATAAIYSASFITLDYLFNLTLRGPKINPFKLLMDSGLEILLTAVLAAVGFGLASLFLKRLNPKYLSEKKI